MSEIVASILMLAVIGPCIYWYNNESCSQKAVGFEQHDYGFFKGCMVKHKGKWLPIENIRGFDDK